MIQNSLAKVSTVTIGRLAENTLLIEMAKMKILVEQDSSFISLAKTLFGTL
jgi:hypothetical protein